MNYYGYPLGYNPHHPRPSTGSGPATPVEDVADSSRHSRARLDGGQWISQDGEMIYHFRFGDYWRAHWFGGQFGAWERSPELPEGTVKL